MPSLQTEASGASRAGAVHQVKLLARTQHSISTTTIQRLHFEIILHECYDARARTGHRASRGIPPASRRFARTDNRDGAIHHAPAMKQFPLLNVLLINYLH